MDNLKSKPARNGIIEFMRFIFSLVVICYHGLAFLPKDSQFLRFPNGAIAVEFFFVLSGFLMAKTASKKLHNETSIGIDSAKFICKKYLSIFPYHLYAFIFTFIITVIINNFSFVEMIKSFVNAIPNLFLLDMTGLPNKLIVGYEWYISAMLIAMAVIYPFLRRWFNLTTKVFAPVISLLLLGWIWQKYGQMTYISLWTGFAFKGVIRAFAEILLGCAAYSVYEKIKNLNFTAFGKFSLLVIEAIGYTATLLYAATKKSETYYFYLILFIALSIAVSFSGKTITCQIFKSKVFMFLGKLSLPLYLNQYGYLLIVDKYFTNIQGNYRIIIFLSLTIVSSLLCLFIVDFLKKKVNLKNLFIAK